MLLIKWVAEPNGSETSAPLDYLVMKPSRPHTIFMALLVGCFVPFLLAAKDPAPIFFHSHDSDEWVDHSIHVQ
jgi:hypothetical protein